MQRFTSYHLLSMKHYKDLRMLHNVQWIILFLVYFGHFYNCSLSFIQNQVKILRLQEEDFLLYRKVSNLYSTPFLYQLYDEWSSM